MWFGIIGLDFFFFLFCDFEMDLKVLSRSLFITHKNQLP